MTRLPALASRLGAARVLVVGDVMLDEYIVGDVRRVSPEAPVPVVEMVTTAHALGGCGNAAANVAALGAGVALSAVVGDDDDGAVVRKLLAESGIEDGTRIVSDRPTTRKLRVIAGPQQIVRVDTESSRPLEPSVERDLEQWVGEHLERCDAVLLSDYGKGVLSAAFARSTIEMCRRRGKPVVVDPKGVDFTRYAGATVIAPNKVEAYEAARHLGGGDADLETVGSLLLDALGTAGVLITCGADGMRLFTDGSEPLAIPAEAHHVYDVTGAGDTVSAVAVLALATGASLQDAARISNVAAVCAVETFGTHPVTLEELLAKLRSMTPS